MASFVEKTVSKGSLFLTGDRPTQADHECVQVLKLHLNALSDFPNTFAWFCLVSRFSDKVVASWPAAKGISIPGEKAPASKK